MKILKGMPPDRPRAFDARPLKKISGPKLEKTRSTRKSIPGTTLGTTEGKKRPQPTFWF